MAEQQTDQQCRRHYHGKNIHKSVSLLKISDIFFRFSLLFVYNLQNWNLEHWHRNLKQLPICALERLWGPVIIRPVHIGHTVYPWSPVNGILIEKLSLAEATVKCGFNSLHLTNQMGNFAKVKKMTLY